MPYRFFYIGPREVNLLLQDAFKRAQTVKLTDERLVCYDIVPASDAHRALNQSKYSSLLRELWKVGDQAILFFDDEYDESQRKKLLHALAGSKAITYPLRRPAATNEDCFRAALMMMSTPVWTQAYLHQSYPADDALLEEYERVLTERNELQHELALLTSQNKTVLPTLIEVVEKVKKEHHPHLLRITEVTERTAKNCRFSDSNVAAEALAAIADYLELRKKGPEFEPDLEAHFNKHGFHFAPTNTGVTKSQQAEHYKVIHENVAYETHMHLKKGAFRLYFHLDGKTAVIGSIGDHLPTAGYKD
ncbi:hypothetical protein BH10PLA1_BH10PLA1_18460 [soil metagenome]